MLKKVFAILLVLIVTMSLAACGAGEETTLTGVVVSVEGTVISIVEMDAGNRGGRDFAEGERPERPEGETFPQRTDDERPEKPEGETFPQQGKGEGPERPDDMELPEGATIPDDGNRPGATGENDGMRPGFGGFNSDAETKDLDIGNAHISVEIDGGKATGSIEDIQAGTFVTVTINGKGEVTNVLVSSRSAFGGGSRPQN